MDELTTNDELLVWADEGFRRTEHDLDKRLQYAAILAQCLQTKHWETAHPTA